MQRLPPHKPGRGWGETTRDFGAVRAEMAAPADRVVISTARSETPAGGGEFRNTLRRKRKRHRGLSAAFCVNWWAGFVCNRPSNSAVVTVFRRTIMAAWIVVLSNNETYARITICIRLTMQVIHFGAGILAHSTTITSEMMRYRR